MEKQSSSTTDNTKTRKALEAKFMGVEIPEYAPMLKEKQKTGYNPITDKVETYTIQVPTSKAIQEQIKKQITSSPNGFNYENPDVLARQLDNMAMAADSLTAESYYQKKYGRKLDGTTASFNEAVATNNKANEVRSFITRPQDTGSMKMPRELVNVPYQNVTTYYNGQNDNSKYTPDGSVRMVDEWDLAGPYNWRYKDNNVYTDLTVNKPFKAMFHPTVNDVINKYNPVNEKGVRETDPNKIHFPQRPYTIINPVNPVVEAIKNPGKTAKRIGLQMTAHPMSNHTDVYFDENARKTVKR